MHAHVERSAALQKLKVGAVLPVGMLASTSPGLTPASNTHPVAGGPIVGGFHRNVTWLPEIAAVTRFVGGCTVVAPTPLLSENTECSLEIAAR